MPLSFGIAVTHRASNEKPPQLPTVTGDETMLLSWFVFQIFGQ